MDIPPYRCLRSSRQWQVWQQGLRISIFLSLRYAERVSFWQAKLLLKLSLLFQQRFEFVLVEQL